MRPTPILAAAAALLIPAGVAAAQQCDPGTIAGAVTHVRDGDTIEVEACRSAVTVV